MKILSLFILFILCSYSGLATNNIYEFDEKTNIILTTSVYRDGMPDNESVCNLTVFLPPPLETFINFSVIMNNKGLQKNYSSRYKE